MPDLFVMAKFAGPILIFLAAFAAGPAFAWPPTYGSEFNFSSELLDKAWRTRRVQALMLGKDAGNWQFPGEVEQAAARKFAKAVQDACGGDCDVVPHRGKFDMMEYKVKFKNGFSFNISLDPSCVEIQTAPQTLAEMKKFEGYTQKYIFDIAKKIELDKFDMPAHFNIGFVSAFGDDAKSFLRFFSNYQTMQELASGALGEDFYNAPPLSHLKKEQRARFSQLVQDANSGKLKSAKEAAIRLLDEVYTETPYVKDGAPGDEIHYQGVSVKQLDHTVSARNDKPFELRAPRQPRTAYERTLLAELLEKRLAFERESKEPIAFVDVGMRKSFTDLELANRFRMYLMEMGLDWDKYKAVLTPSQRAQPADAFIRGRVNWNDWNEVGVLKEYVPFMGNSAWARARMFQMLRTPEARASVRYEELVGAIRLEFGDHADPVARANIANLVEQLGKPLPSGCPVRFQHLIHTR